MQTAREIAEQFVDGDAAADLERAILRHMEHHMMRAREACALVAERWGQREDAMTDTAFVPGASHGEKFAAAGIAAAIRNRS